MVEVKVGEEDVEAGRLRRRSARPRLRIPVPASRASREPSESVTPTRRCCRRSGSCRPRGGDRATRAPELELHLSARPRSRGWAEDGDRPVGAVGREDREGGDLDGVEVAVGRADLEGRVGGTVVADRDDQRQLVVGDRVAVGVERPEHRPPLVGADHAEFLEAFAEQRPGSLVVEDEQPALVDQEGRRRERRHQVAGEDQLERLLWSVVLFGRVRQVTLDRLFAADGRARATPKTKDSIAGRSPYVTFITFVARPAHF